MSVYQGSSMPRTGRPRRKGKAWSPRWQDWVNVVLGIWLCIAPWLLAKSSGVSTIGANLMVEAWGVGLIIVVMSICGLARPSTAAPEWINMLVGLWLFVSPWALSISATMPSISTDDWIVGVLVFVLAWSASYNVKPAHTSRKKRF